MKPVHERILSHVSKRMKEGKLVGENFYNKLELFSNPFSSYDQPMICNFNKLFVGRKKEVERLTDHMLVSSAHTGKDIIICGPLGCGRKSLIYCITRFLEETLKPETEKGKNIDLKTFRDNITPPIHKFGIEQMGQDTRDYLEKEIETGLNSNKKVFL